MNLLPDSAPRPAAGRGFVLGELLVAALLLALAISSLTALMYTVTRNPGNQAPVECTANGTGGSPKCVVEKPRTPSAAAKLLVSGCATRRGSDVRCADSSLSARAPDGTVIRSRTDSAALAMLPVPKKEKRPKRTDLGFIR